MILFNYMVIIVMAIVSFCYSAEIPISDQRNPDNNLLKIIDILKIQDEKINHLHTLLVTNQFLPKCTSAIQSGNLLKATKCWQDMTKEIKAADQSATTESKLLGQLVTDAYEGEKTRLLTVVQFIKKTVEKGSESAYAAYNALLNGMDDYGQLYMKKIPTDNGLGSGFIDYTFRTLIEIRNAEGEASPIFTQLLPKVLNSILSGKEVLIRNSMTKDFMYAPPENSNENTTKISVNGGGNENDPRYIWKLRPVDDRWKNQNQELFYIENTLDNKILAVADNDGSLRLAEPTEERLKSTWAMFYIRLVQGTSGEEVAIQCSYWGIRTLGLDEEHYLKLPRLLSSESLVPTAIWLLQQKVE